MPWPCDLSGLPAGTPRACSPCLHKTASLCLYQYSRNTAANTANTQRLYRPQQSIQPQYSSQYIQYTAAVSSAATQPPHDSGCIIGSNCSYCIHHTVSVSSTAIQPAHSSRVACSSNTAIQPIHGICITSSNNTAIQPMQPPHSSHVTGSNTTADTRHLCQCQQ